MSGSNNGLIQTNGEQTQPASAPAISESATLTFLNRLCPEVSSDSGLCLIEPEGHNNGEEHNDWDNYDWHSDLYTKETWIGYAGSDTESSSEANTPRDSSKFSCPTCLKACLCYNSYVLHLLDCRRFDLKLHRLTDEEIRSYSLGLVTKRKRGRPAKRTLTTDRSPLLLKLKRKMSTTNTEGSQNSFEDCPEGVQLPDPNQSTLGKKDEMFETYLKEASNTQCSPMMDLCPVTLPFQDGGPSTPNSNKNSPERDEDSDKVDMMEIKARTEEYRKNFASPELTPTKDYDKVVPKLEQPDPMNNGENTGDSGVNSPAPPSPAPPSPAPPSPLPPDTYDGLMPLTPPNTLGNASPSSDTSNFSTTSTVMATPSEAHRREPVSKEPKDETQSDQGKPGSQSGDEHGSERSWSPNETSSSTPPVSVHSGSGGIAVRPQAELLAPSQEPFSALQGLVSDIQTNEGLKVFSPMDAGILNGPGQFAQPPPPAQLRCQVCGLYLPGPQALDSHRNAAGHWTCSECPPNVGTFATSLDLGMHAQTVHNKGPQRLGGVTVYPSQMNSTMQSPPPPYSMSQSRPSNHMTMVTPQLGPGVILTPSNGSSSSSGMHSLPNLPPGVQVSKRPAPQPSPPQPVQKQRRNDDGPVSPSIRLPDSITLVRPGVSITAQGSSSRISSSESNTSSVADMLATRGITVVPSSGRNIPVSSPSLSVTKTSAVPASLNSAVSITPANPQRQSAMFAVPNRRTGAGVQPMPTVDLTQEAAPPALARAPVPQPRAMGPGGSHMRGPNRAASRARVTCQVCDKIFASPDALQMHMQSHRQGGTAPAPRGHTPMKLPYECKLCTAQYPTMQGLAAHRQKYHPGEESELALPVVDLKQPGVTNRLHSLGIRFAIPLTQLHNRTDGIFCLPVIPVDSMQNPAVCNIGAIGASNLLPIGTMKTIKR